MRFVGPDFINGNKPNGRPARWVTLWTVFSILAAAFLSGCSGANPQLGSAGQNAPQNRISQQTLEEQYGMRVTLVAVTAVGGLIDVRVKVLDTQKASQIMTDTTDVPSLIVERTGTILHAAGDEPITRPLEEGMLYFFLYPNSGTVVAEGSLVVVDFGEVQVEPIAALK